MVLYGVMYDVTYRVVRNDDSFISFVSAFLVCGEGFS